MKKNTTANHLFDSFLLLSIVFGIVTTIVEYYGFGAGDHIEQIPLILRAFDKSFLFNDFFLNSSLDSIARQYYVNLIANLAGTQAGLPILMYLLTILANVAISVMTYLFTKERFHNDKQAGILAAALVMSVTTFVYGYSSTIYRPTLIPSTLAIPLVFGAIWAVAKDNLILGIILSGTASFIHPLLGLEIGGLLFAVFIIREWITTRKLLGIRWRVFSISLLLFIGFALVSLVPQLSQSEMSSEQFVYLLAYFRHPHLYVPSTFSTGEFISGIAFLSAMVFLFIDQHKRQEHDFNTTFGILSALILLVCVGGYVFVEIVPSRIWATAQTFRLLYFVKWFGLILLAGEIASLPQASSKKTLYLASALHPIPFAVTVYSQALRKWAESKRPWLAAILDPLPLLVLAIGVIVGAKVYLNAIFLFGFFMLLIMLFSSTAPKTQLIIIAVGTMLMVLIFGLHNHLPYINHLTPVQKIARTLNWKVETEFIPEGNEVAFWARDNTPTDAIFLTPPYWGNFRLLARRAIVVDFKAFPFSDEGMAAWHQRIIDIYGKSKKPGFDALNDYEISYIHINDDRITNLKQKYRFSYAVLYQETATQYKVVFSNEVYKVVVIDE